jgi:hypothetical protein
LLRKQMADEKSMIETMSVDQSLPSPVQIPS